MSKTSETPGPAIKPVPSINRWNEGFAPADIVEGAQDDIEDIQDIVVVIRYGRSTRQDDIYNVLSSSMPMHELLGLLDLGKLMSVSSHSKEPDKKGTS